MHYVRTAAGKSSIAVLYQQNGGPYSNFLSVVDFEGKLLAGPVALDPSAMYGSFGGDIKFDGSAFVAAWRSNDGAGGGEVRWIRVDEATLDVGEPILVAASGNDDPIGRFDPFTFLSIETIGTTSAVGFVRKHFDAVLDFAVNKAQIALVDATGVVGEVRQVSSASDLAWHHELRLAKAGDGLVALWGSDDLLSNENNIPTDFFARSIDGAGQLTGLPQRIVAAPAHRVEPFAISHPEKHIVMAWLDERSYAAGNGLDGRIELYVANLDDSMTTSAPLIFDHARFIEGTSQLRGTRVGVNVLLTWLDERTGGGIGNSRPEVYLETVWN